MKEDFCKKERGARYAVSDEDDRLVFNFRDIDHTMRFLYEGRGSQKHILIVLLECGDITQQKLTERLGIQPGSASEVLAKLEKGGLITRTESPTDRRTTDVKLTKAGREAAEEAAKQRRIRHKEMFSCLSGEEKTSLLALLEKVNADWEERYRKKEEFRRRGCGRRCGHDNGGGHHHGKEGR